MARALPLLVASIFVVLAGCSAENGPDGQAVSGTGSLVYNGAANGSHDSHISCDGSGEVEYSYNVGMGTLTLRVVDGNGATAFSKSFTGPKNGASTQAVSGSSGSWHVEAERSGAGYGSFSGQYAIALDC